MSYGRLMYLNAIRVTTGSALFYIGEYLIEKSKWNKLLFIVLQLLKKFNYFWTSQPKWGYFQKQPPKIICEKRCSRKIRQFHRKTLVLESLFNKAAGLKACNFIKARPQNRYFPVKLVKFLRTSILKNMCERLLLDFLGVKCRKHDIYKQ